MDATRRAMIGATAAAFGLRFTSQAMAQGGGHPGLVDRFGHAIALVLETAPQHAPHLVIVVNDQDVMLRFRHKSSRYKALQFSTKRPHSAYMTGVYRTTTTTGR